MFLVLEFTFGGLLEYSFHKERKTLTSSFPTSNRIINLFYLAMINICFSRLRRINFQSVIQQVRSRWLMIVEKCDSSRTAAALLRRPFNSTFAVLTLLMQGTNFLVFSYHLSLITSLKFCLSMSFSSFYT